MRSEWKCCKKEYPTPYERVLVRHKQTKNIVGVMDYCTTYQEYLLVENEELRLLMEFDMYEWKYVEEL